MIDSSASPASETLRSPFSLALVFVDCWFSPASKTSNMELLLLASRYDSEPCPRYLFITRPFQQV